ncbi:MAG TPA: OpgC domain-containing protein, partial [Roseiarcus sp.]|nr:OpgC domain-containing protein [Roseiarcus sp.]
MNVNVVRTSAHYKATVCSDSLRRPRGGVAHCVWLEPIEEWRRSCVEAYEMKANRVRDIDFWRGAVLIAILIDHIPGNPLEHWTPRNFGLSDSAEAFVFLSGL